LHELRTYTNSIQRNSSGLAANRVRPVFAPQFGLR